MVFRTKTANISNKIIKIFAVPITVFCLVLLFQIKANAEVIADDFINRCYLVTVGREADEEGFEYWNNRIVNSELVGTQVAYGFVFSAEYQNKDKSNEEYVKDLYMLFLGREPDEEGFENWVNALEEGKSRLSVFAGFANSNEFYNLCEACGITAGYFTDECENERLNGINLFTDRLYRICLGRQGEREGQEYWVKALSKGELTGTDCAAGFANSPEYRNNGLTDIEYVENMYKACLGRNSEKDGLKYWATALANGLTRDELFEGFANSDEFDGICANYGIVRGTYTAEDKGTYDPQNPDLIPVDIPDNPNNEEPDNPEQPEYPVFDNINEGDIILFGRYEQDADSANGSEEIKWQVLSVEDGKILAVSLYSLDCIPYNNEFIETTWEECSLRKWLNEDFYNTAFSVSEKNLIPAVTLENSDHPMLHTDGGNDTEDKVFCLSLEETEKYFGEYDWYDEKYKVGMKQSLICPPTEYAISKGAYYYDLNEEDYDYYKDYGYTEDIIGLRGSWWWLRTPGRRGDFASDIFTRGNVGANYGNLVNNSYVSVRPAIYIDISDRSAGLESDYPNADNESDYQENDNE